MTREETESKIKELIVGSLDLEDLRPEDIEADIFYKAVKGEGELVVKPEQAYVVTQILDAIYKSSETGEPVYFD